MTYSESKKIKQDLKMALIFIAIGLLMFGARFLIAPAAERNIGSAEEMTKLDQQVSSATQQLNTLQYSIDASGKVFVDLVSNKDNYVRALGLLCDANRLNIHKMTVDDITQEEGSSIITLPVRLELQGDLYNIRSFLSDLNESEMLCRVNTLSYRLSNESFSWMWRAIDNENVVNWWDISNVKDYLLEDPDVEEEEEDGELLDASVFMRHGSALCYMEVQFIGTMG